MKHRLEVGESIAETKITISGLYAGLLLLVVGFSFGVVFGALI